MKKRLVICILAVICLATLAFSACSETHTITIVAEDGTKTEITVKDGETVASVVGDDMDLFTDAECTQPFDPNAVVTGDLTLYTKGGSTISVTFVTNGGSVVATINLTRGDALPSDVPTPTKQNYVFEGWYTDSALTQKYVDGTPINKTLTLYANWTRTHYAVTLKVFTQEKVVNVPVGSKLDLAGKLDDFNYNDYAFAFTGWWKDEAGNAYGADEQIDVKGDMVLTAEFDAIDVVYVLDDKGEYYVVETVLNIEWTTLTIPATYKGLPVKSIHSLGSSSALKDVIIPDSVQSIDEGAFANLSGLVSIDAPFLGAELISALPTGNDYVGKEGVFGYWFYEDFLGDYRSGYHMVPSQYYEEYYDYDEEEPFKGATQTYFYYPETLRYVTIRNGVIPDIAFYNATTIAKVTLGNGVTAIGKYSFSNDTMIDSLPHRFIELYIDENSENFTTFGENAFRGNCSLTTVTIPNKVTVLPKELFYNCLALTTVHINDENSQLKEIGTQAFYVADPSAKASLTFINLPLKLETIGTMAFSNSSLETIQFPASVSTIGGAAFRGAKSLWKVVFDKDNPMTELTGGIFDGCSALTSVELSANMSVIGSNAFDGCKLLSTFDFDTISEIGNFAFRSTGFVTVTLPASLTKLGTGAFALCDELTSMTFECQYNEDIQLVGMFDNCLKLTTVVLPEGITTIGDNLFKNCESLTTITIPASVTEIGTNAFGGTSGGLETIIFAPGSKLETIGDYAFWSRDKLTSISLPSTLKSIGARAFEFCYGLTEVTFASGTSGLTIGANAFHRDFRLGSIDLSVAISIGNNAFEDCAALSTVAIPNTMVSMGSNAFARTADLGNQTWFTDEGLTAGDVKELTITVNMTLIESLNKGWPYGNNSWSGSPNYDNVTFTDNGKLVIFDEMWLGALNGDGDILVLQYVGDMAEVELPDKINYQQTDHNVIWSTGVFKDNKTITKVTLHAALTDIPDSFFEGSSIVEVVGANVTDIGNSAFSEARSLATVGINFANVTSIGANAFAFNSNQTAWKETITLSSKLTNIGERAFFHCANLCINLSGDALEGLTEISAYAFSYTRILVGEDGILTIPSNIESIGVNAFNMSRDYLSNDFAPSSGLGRVSALVIDANDNLSIGANAFTSLSFYNSQARYVKLAYILIKGTPKYIGETFAGSNWYGTSSTNNKTRIYLEDVTVEQSGTSGPVSGAPGEWHNLWYAHSYNDDEDTVSYRTVYGKGTWHYEDGVPTPGAGGSANS